jgi:hypothetical protein
VPFEGKKKKKKKKKKLKKERKKSFSECVNYKPGLLHKEKTARIQL